MRRARQRRLDALAAAELAWVQGGIGILLPALGKPKQSADSPAYEEISISHEGMVRTE